MRLVLLLPFVMRFPEHRRLFISISCPPSHHPRHHHMARPSPPSQPDHEPVYGPFVTARGASLPKTQTELRNNAAPSTPTKVEVWASAERSPTTLPLGPQGRHLPCPSPHPGAAQLAEPSRDALTRPGRPCGAAGSFPSSPQTPLSPTWRWGRPRDGVSVTGAPPTPGHGHRPPGTAPTRCRAPEGRGGRPDLQSRVTVLTPAAAPPHPIPIPVPSPASAHTLIGPIPINRAHVNRIDSS